MLVHDIMRALLHCALRSEYSERAGGGEVNFHVITRTDTIDVEVPSLRRRLERGPRHVKILFR